MTLTADALWLDSFFSGYDTAILSFAHKLAEAAGTVLTPFNKLITLLGEKGLLFILLGIVLMLFPRWRKAGVCIFGAVGCAAVLKFVLKDMIARPRPFESVEQFRQWWEFVGAPAEDGFSFPSGHVSAAAAGVTGLCLMRGRRWFIPGAIWVLLMMFSRNYLMAHYPSDVLFGLLVGVFSGFVAAGITNLIFRFLESHSGEGRVYDFLLEAGFEDLSDIKTLLPRKSEEDTPASVERSAHSEPVKTTRRAAASTAKHARGTTSSSSGGYQGKH
ncbi:MAG: phosphatase PAP2 family protein [Oscillospiraceae bacterium]|nr:phosphatase PAP2 family protein [Oscillospiraceae bacterium]